MHENITNETNYFPPAPLGGEQRCSDSHQRRRRSYKYSYSCCPTTSGSSGEDGLLLLSDGMVRTIFLLLGIGILIPWNAFVSAKPYFTARLCQSSGHDIVNFEQWFGLVWNFSSVLSLGLIIASQSFSDYWNKKDAAQSLPSNNVDGIINDNAAATPTHDSNLVEEPNRSEDRSSSFDTHARARPENDRSTSSSSSSLINGTRAGSSKNRSTSLYNVVVPLGLYTVVFSIQAVLVTIPDLAPTHFLLVTLLSLAVCGTCGAIATAGIVSTAGHFAPHLGIHPFFSGQAVGGAAVALANFAAIAIGEDPEEYFEKYCRSSMTNNDIEAPMLLSTHHLSGLSRSTKQRGLENDNADSSCSPYQNLDGAVLCYFLAGCLVLFLCMVGYQKVHQYQHTRHRCVYETVGDRQDDDRPVINSSSGVSYHDESPRLGLELHDRILQRRQQMESTSSSENENDDENQLEQDAFNDETAEEEYTDPDNGRPTSILPVIRGPAACIFLTFSLTLSLFPSWVSELKSSHACENQYNRLNNDLYVPLSFVVFNIGDLVGRLLSGYIPVHRIRYVSQKLIAGALLRTLLLPGFLLCSTTIAGSSEESSSMVIRNDFFSLSVQLLFAISNGLLISTSFLWFSQLVGTEDATVHKRASDIMTFSLSLGLLSGSFLAFPLLRLAAQLLQQY